MKSAVFSKWFLIKLGMICTIFLMGCGAAHVKVYKDLNSGFYIPKDSNPYAVAILPFETDEELSRDKPDIILREVFFAYFSYLGYADMPPAEVDRKLKAAGYTLSLIHI